MSVLEIRNLHAGVEGEAILHGLDLTVKSGEIHALMGPNGSGKSTLSHVLMGHPRYEVYDGDVLLDGTSILGLLPHYRARLGLFLGFQYPQEVPGVKLGSFLNVAYKRMHPETEMEVPEFFAYVDERMDLLKLDASFGGRYLNEGFSGGEKKRAEVLQMLVLAPRIAVLDESDSGLDIDALKTVARAIDDYAGPDVGILLITHYQRLLDFVTPDFVHVLVDGEIARSGGSDLAQKLEELGYKWIKEEPGVEVI
ncbi:MAG: Fe-S cluster assembly ATPase SufC [Thermoplasmata archaeon]